MTEKKIHLTTKDYLITKEEFSLEIDNNYDMLITKPQPKNLDKYYQTINYISHTDQAKTFIDKIYQTVKKYTLTKKIKLLNEYSKKGKSILDIGCGTGEFLALTKNQNWTSFGIEPNENARRKAKLKNIDVTANFEELNQQKFNVITLWHVLEHLPDLPNQIKKITNLLETKGTLIIAVPNFKSYDAKYYKEHWAAYDTPRHLWHFSQQSIINLFKEKNFKVIKTIPMKFDSYYVSLLSEKYKNGKQNYLKAIYRGWLSNYKAKRTTEYSSLIYVLKKE
ncbi:class I SAM-dependent methyltransferase [uncultured Maribacter sp.]|uniref:class I SAM-dependent methyltransferase n=1 Tax=uncultured Maribacter sp. TaxID=431308 RepID=UPI0030D9AFA3|tara:strand:+ start:721 stop:1557 length:837 start_codon:yes stop_codon:yes gene_type:complete